MEKIRKIFEILDEFCVNTHCDYCPFDRGYDGCKFEEEVGVTPCYFVNHFTPNEETGTSKG